MTCARVFSLTQVLDVDGSGGLDSFEFCAAIKKLVRKTLRARAWVARLTRAQLRIGHRCREIDRIGVQPDSWFVSSQLRMRCED